MKLKLTYSEFTTLFGVCHNFLQMDLPTDMEGKILHVLLTKMFRRLYNLSFEKKKKYSVSIKEEEAMAFWLTYNNHEYEITSHEGNLLTVICNLIHQRFEKPTYVNENTKAVF